MNQTCGTCRHGKATDTRPPLDGHRHCALGHPQLRNLPIAGWLIGQNMACSYSPPRWEPK